MEKRLSSRPSYQLFVTFLPEKQHLSPAKKFNSPCVCDENESHQPSALWTKTSGNFPPESDSFQFKKCNFVTFQDVWWVRILTTTHYNSIHMSAGFD